MRSPLAQGRCFRLPPVCPLPARLQSEWDSFHLSGGIVQALVKSPMIVVIDEVVDGSFEVAWQVVVFELDLVFQGLMPAFDLALRLWMMGRTINRICTKLSHAYCFGTDINTAVLSSSIVGESETGTPS